MNVFSKYYPHPDLLQGEGVGLSFPPWGKKKGGLNYQEKRNSIYQDI